MTAYMGLLDLKSSNRCIMLPSYTHACVALECALCFCESVMQACSTLPTRWQCTMCLESLPCCINGVYLSTSDVSCLPVAVPYLSSSDVSCVYLLQYPTYPLAMYHVFTCCSTLPTRWRCTTCLESLPCCTMLHRPGLLT